MFAVHAANANIGMQDFAGPKSLAPVRTGPLAMVVLAATMIGASSGILIADRNAVLLLRRDIASQLAGFGGCLLESSDATSAEPNIPSVIPTGLTSIAAIYYSSKPDSAQVAFGLEALDLVQTGKLHSPDRIYFDLRDRSPEQGRLRRLRTNKAVSLAGDLLTGVRISQRKPDALRIVLDLKRASDFTYQTSPGPLSRLMVEIRPRPADASASM